MSPDVLLAKPPLEREAWITCAVVASDAEAKAQAMLSKPRQPAKGRRRRGR